MHFCRRRRSAWILRFAQDDSRQFIIERFSGRGIGLWGGVGEVEPSFRSAGQPRAAVPTWSENEDRDCPRLALGFVTAGEGET